MTYPLRQHFFTGSPTSLNSKVITGFNTDIEYQGVTYHVQTEDKGLNTPFILSLIYNGGTILASKRSPYDDLVSNFDEQILIERLRKQHKLICAAVRAGRIEDLKRMSSREAATKRLQSVKKTVKSVEQKNIVSRNGSIPALKAVQNPEERISRESRFQDSDNVFIAQGKTHIQPEPKPENIIPPFEKPKVISQSEQTNALPNQEFHLPKIENKVSVIETGSEESGDFSINLTHEDLIIDAPVFTDEFPLFPPEAIAIIDNTENAAVDDRKIKLEFLEEINFKGGESETVTVSVTRGQEKEPIGDANLITKVLGSTFRPVIFHTKTDKIGIAVVQVSFPHFSKGRAALLIKATDGDDEAEIRRMIEPG